MSSELEIEKIITLSTAHITKATNDLLMNNPDKVNFSLRQDEYGYFFSTICLGDSDNPEDIQAIMSFAVENGCSYINLDRDGPIVPQLPEYDW